LRRAVRAAALAVLCVVTVVGAEEAPTTAPPPLRVGIAQRAEEVAVGSAADYSVRWGSEEVTIAGGAAVTFAAGGRRRIGIAFPDGTRRAALDSAVSVTPTTAPLEYMPPEAGGAHRAYHGTFEIVIDAAHQLSLVDVVGVEDYLLGVVGREMSPTYPAEALKAQAVAARTYALRGRDRHRADGFDVCGTEHCQVYGGMAAEKPTTTDAVTATAGEVVWYGDGPALTLFSSTCGGITEDFEAVYGGAPIPYLRSVPDYEPTDPVGIPPPQSEDGLVAWLRGTPRAHCLQPRLGRYEVFRWVEVRERAALEAALGAWGLKGDFLGFEVVKRGKSGRIGKLIAHGSTRDATLETESAIRDALGLRSSAFVMDAYPRSGRPAVVIFWGGGWGHGVGMCQMGAVGLALDGWGYQAILQKYYTGVEIRKMY